MLFVVRMHFKIEDTCTCSCTRAKKLLNVYVVRLQVQALNLKDWQLQFGTIRIQGCEWWTTNIWNCRYTVTWRDYLISKLHNASQGVWYIKDAPKKEKGDFTNVNPCVNFCRWTTKTWGCKEGVIKYKWTKYGIRPWWRTSFQGL